jgi:potassium-transporting ATPase KdpC subunit
MKQHILPALRLTLICLIIFSGIYTLLILGIAQFAPNHGEGVSLQRNGKIIGYVLEAQNFTNDGYFMSRPSATGYNAAGSAGSNKGPTNPDYLKDVQTRIDSFIVHNKSVRPEQIPAELVTASGSGLDPDISPAGAYVQIPRIAATRGLSPEKIHALVDQSVEPPLFGLFGPEKVNVLKLNLALDQIKQ